MINIIEKIIISLVLFFFGIVFYNEPPPYYSHGVIVDYGEMSAVIALVFFTTGVAVLITVYRSLYSKK